MVSLLDIADIKMTATIRGKQVEVRGILAEHLATLFQRFPELRRIWVNKADKDVVMSLINQFPLVVAELIAIGCGGEPGDKDYDKLVNVARTLSVGEQFIVLQKIGEVTFPQGPKAFLEGVAGALGIPPEDLPGWGQVQNLQSPSSDASKPDETSETAGEAPPAS